MHKLIDIPFEMTATLTVTDDGWIRIHPTKMDISGLNGLLLLRAVGRTLADLLDLSGGKGVKVDGNDILLDPTVAPAAEDQRQDHGDSRRGGRDHPEFGWRYLTRQGRRRFRRRTTCTSAAARFGSASCSWSTPIC